MSHPVHSSERIIIVGGGFAGLSAAVRLAQAGLPVTVMEQSTLGYAASSRNQGWLQSGAWFARGHPNLARMCYDSLQQTLQFCPECIEPHYGSMVYFSSSNETGLSEWTQAFDQIGIPYERLSRSELEQALPTVDRKQLQSGLRLPDRSFRPDMLLGKLAAAARNAGAEIRPDTFVSELLIGDSRVEGVRVGTNEEIPARLVIVAAGAYSQQSFSHLFEPGAGRQSDYRLVCLKTHLRAIQPETGCDPFCVVDSIGLNHLPHFGTSVFGTSRWRVVPGVKDEHVEPSEIDKLDAELQLLFPQGFGPDAKVLDWAGTTVQAMHAEQVEPGDAPLPTIVDHATEPSGVEGVISIFPGRATLWAQLAEQVRTTVLNRCDSRASETTPPPWTLTPS